MSKNKKTILTTIIIILLGLAMMSFNAITEVVTVTVYNPVKAQCNADYWHTASNKKIDTLNPLRHRWIAVSRDLEKKGFTFGTKVEIIGVGKYSGIWTVQDRMNKRFTNRVDLLVGKHNSIGKWDNINIKLIY